MVDVVWLIPALPLAGFLLILLFGRKLGDPKAGYLATAMIGSAFVVTVGVFADLMSMDVEERRHVATLFQWVPVGSLHIDLAFLADPLSITMCLFVTGIGTLIHLYAVGYMHGDPRFSKFFLYLNLFALSMLVLVLGENLLVTFLGWEGVGTCSYFLISFWHERESAATAGKKAFVTNRVGDWGVMIAMFLAFQAVGTVSYGGLNAAAETGALSQTTATAIAAMLFIGTYLTFLPMFAIGVAGASFRANSYPPTSVVPEVLATAGMTILLAGLGLSIIGLSAGQFAGWRAPDDRRRAPRSTPASGGSRGGELR